jgi:hypothetical protein
VKRLFLINGDVTEVKSEEFFRSQERVAELEGLLRESLKCTGDGAWHRRVYKALGEEPPPLRKLTGKVPRYQRKADD